MKFSTVTLLAMSGLANAATPSYCQPPAPDNKNGYNYYDVSEQCKKAGIADNCCVTVVDGGYADLQCNKDELEKTKFEDLHSALAQHVTKDGQWETTTVGGWQFNFQLFTTALDRRELFIPWNDGINDFQTDNDFKPTGIYFNAVTKKKYYQVYGKWTC